MSRKISYPLILFILLALHAANPLLATARQPVEGSSRQVPNGLNAVQWQNIQQQIQFGIAPLAGSPDTYTTNAGQWQVRFDPSGVTMSEGANERKGEWVKFTLADSSSRNLTNSQPRLFADSSTRLTYYHNANLQERFDNSAAGLKQTFILQERSMEYGVWSKLLTTSYSSRRLRLSLSGSLTPQLQDDQTLLLQNEDGQTQLTYAGLYVYDARGVTMPSHFELTGTTLTIVVDDAQAVYPLTIDPIVTQQAYIKTNLASYQLGYRVALSGDTLVASTYTTYGKIYVFVRSGTTWSQQAVLTSSNFDMNDLFPYDLDIDGDTIVAGGPFEQSNATIINGNQADNSATQAGAAYVFVRSGTTWSQQAYLKASDNVGYANFGINVGISGNTIMVGANVANGGGKAYVFVRSGTTWTQQAAFAGSNTQGGDNFGTSVDISGNTIVVGADSEGSSATGVNGNQADNSAGGSGAAYVFVRSGTI